MSGETGPDPSELYRQQQEAYEKNRQVREDEPHWELPALNKINFYIEAGKLPEDREKFRKDWRRAGIELFDPLLQLQIDARTRFNFSDYSVTRLTEMADGHLRDFQQAVIDKDGFEDFGNLEFSGLAKQQNTNLVRIKSFHHLENHTIGFKNFYYDKSGVFKLLVTGRRHGAINAGDFIHMMKPLDGLTLTAAETQALPIPEKDLYGEEISRMTADIEHFERAVGAMNRYNASKPTGQEMFMNVPTVERKLIRKLFGTTSTVDYAGPTAINGKEFSTGLLSYYITADLEGDRKKYEATMKALAECNALAVLSNPSMPREWTSAQSAADKKLIFDNLVTKVEETRDRILKNWSSSVKPFSARLADFAYEQSYNLNTGSQNIAELAYRFKYEILPGGGYKIKVEIPGPETGQDAVNGRSPIVHEVTYKRRKGRGITEMMPWPKTESVDEIILIALNETRGNDPKPIILSRPGLAKGAATIGLYPNEAEKVLQKDDLDQVKKTRGNMQFNETALRVLDSTLWIFDLSAEDCFMPMPIKPMLESFNLYKVMKDGVTGKTVFETVNENAYGTLRDPDYANTIWYATDAWEVNMKMIEDVISMMYGRQDPKNLESFMKDKSAGIGEMVKKMDIGTRAEKWEVEVRKSLKPKLANGSDNPDYQTYEKIEVPKGFIEVMQIAYLTITHAALVKHKIWDKGGWAQQNQTNFWEDVQGWITAALYEPSVKGKFDHYNESMALMMVAIAEWYADATKIYNDEGAGFKDRVDNMTPKRVPYSEPSAKE